MSHAGDPMTDVQALRERLLIEASYHEDRGVASSARMEALPKLLRDAAAALAPPADPVAAPRETGDLGLSIDMLDVDRLRSWANLIDIHGNDISHWSQRQFVIDWLKEFAGRLETAVREIGELRAAHAAGDAPPLAATEDK